MPVSGSGGSSSSDSDCQIARHNEIDRHIHTHMMPHSQLISISAADACTRHACSVYARHAVALACPVTSCVVPRMDPSAIIMRSHNQSAIKRWRCLIRRARCSRQAGWLVRSTHTCGRRHKSGLDTAGWLDVAGWQAGCFNLPPLDPDRARHSAAAAQIAASVNFHAGNERHPETYARHLRGSDAVGGVRVQEGRTGHWFSSLTHAFQQARIHSRTVGHTI